MNFNNYNPIAALQQLKVALYVINKPTKYVKPKFKKQHERTMLEKKRWARIIVGELQEYKRQFPEQYKAFRAEVK